MIIYSVILVKATPFLKKLKSMEETSMDYIGMWPPCKAQNQLHFIPLHACAVILLLYFCSCIESSM